jgi:hypothetical protein
MGKDKDQGEENQDGAGDQGSQQIVVQSVQQIVVQSVQKVQATLKMLKSCLPENQQDDWAGVEPPLKDVHLREKVVKSFPSENLDFEHWMAFIRTSLDENGLRHHLEMNDDIQACGLTDKEKATKQHLDGTLFPCEDKNINKYSIKVMMARR